MKLVFACFAVAVMPLAADFQYTSRTEITGGSMKQMMSMIGRFSKGAMDPTVTTNYIKGGKMAMKGDKSNMVIDADAGTITNIDMDRKEYSVITFEEMMEAMKKVSAQMQTTPKSKEGEVKATMRVDVKEKGAGKTIQGVATKNVLFVVHTDTVVKDEKSGKEATITASIDNDMHLGKIPGSEAFQEYSRKIAGRYTMQQMPMQAMMQGGIDMNGMREAAKKMAEYDGIPMFSLVRITNSAMPGMGATPPPQQSNPGRTAGDVARDNTNAEANNASNEATNAVANSLGRFGGLVRRNKPNVEVAKKQESAPPPAPAQSAPASSASGALLEVTSEVTSFSSAPIDAGVFQVPAGFKHVEHPMKKMAK